MRIEEFDKIHNVALHLVNYYHSDMVDKGGNPYINHLISVSMFCQNKYAKIGGLLHDIIEDTKCTPEILLQNGIPQIIVDAIEVVSRKDGESYSEFIERIIASNNIIALEIKLGDLLNNMDLSRIPTVREKDIKRINTRYIPAKIKIEERLKFLDEYSSINQCNSAISN